MAATPYTRTASGVDPAARPIADWPDVLAGPIVRKTTSSSVAVFVALSVGRRVKLHVYEGRDPATAKLVGSTDWFAPEPIGARLYLAMPRLKAVTLSRGKVYGYDIELAASASKPAQRLKELNLLTGAYPLGYAEGLLPSFVLPEMRDRLRFVHASCRKPHGGGPDALPTIDRILQENIDNLASRPQQLLLTGDQIYADDVAAALLNTLSPLGDALLGWTARETLALDKAEGGSSSINFTHAAVKPGARSELLERQIGKPETFYASNHLLFFGDWCAMYLMAWSPELWQTAASAGVSDGMAYWMTPQGSVVPPKTTPWAVTTMASGMSQAMSDPSARASFMAGVSGGYAHGDDMSPRVREYAELLPRVRRALANVATYMIFDDHEVTDDWYLNGELWLRFRCTKVGRRMLRNALAAYALFQDWGNRPEEYEAAGPGKDLLIRARYTNPDGIAGKPESCDALLDIAAPATNNPIATPHSSYRLQFHYAIAWDDHVIGALDTRTWRYFPESAWATNAIGGLDFAEKLGLFYAGISPVTSLAGLLGAASSQTMEDQLSRGQLKLNAELIEAGVLKTQVGAMTALLPKTDGKQRLLFVISPAPVFGFLIVESMQRLMIVRDGAGGPDEGGAEARDNEPWIGSPEATLRLLQELSGQPVVLLSGDVHYAYSTLVTWQEKVTTRARSQTFLQLCSSASKNSEPLTEVLAQTDHFTDYFASGNPPTGWVKVYLSNYQGFQDVVEGRVPARQSVFWEDLEDKVAGVLGDKAGAHAEEINETLTLEKLQDDLWYSLSLFKQQPMRLLVGDVMTQLPLAGSKVTEMAAVDPMEDLGATLTSLTDTGHGARFTTQRSRDGWYKSFIGDATAWFNGFDATYEKPFLEDWNFLSVGHTNLGLVYLEVDAGDAKPHIVHELLWFPNVVKTGTPSMLGIAATSTCPLAMTRHSTPWPP